jgi:hypothetical protein
MTTDDKTQLLQTFDGRIYGPGWQLELKGSIAYGNPFALRFQGRA